MTGNAMLTMNRKEFLRTGLSTMAAAGLPASAAAAATFGAPEGQGGPLPVAKLDPVIRLYPAKAASRSGALRFGPAELSVDWKRGVEGKRGSVGVSMGGGRIIK